MAVGTTPASRLPVGELSGAYPPTPLPRPYLRGICRLAGAGGGLYSIISFQRGELSLPPLITPFFRTPSQSALRADSVSAAASVGAERCPLDTSAPIGGAKSRLSLWESCLSRGSKGATAPLKILLNIKLKSPSRACKVPYTFLVWAREGVGGGYQTACSPGRRDQGVGMI